MNATATKSEQAETHQGDSGSVCTDLLITEFHEIKANDGFSWARVLWEDSGRVIILSDYGHWSYWWGHRGEGVTVPRFLAKIDMHYAGGKMLGVALWVRDDDATVEAIRETIIELRRTGAIDKDTARSEWERCEQFEAGDIPFDAWCMDSEIDDAYECHRRKVCSEWEQFWRRLWEPHIVPVLRQCD